MACTAGLGRSCCLALLLLQWHCDSQDAGGACDRDQVYPMSMLQKQPARPRPASDPGDPVSMLQKQAARPRPDSDSGGGDVRPLKLTPLLQEGKIQEAQQKARVTLPDWNSSELYSGFFTIDDSTNSQTYFVFSTALSGRQDAPVLLWLNGGPGCSSMLGFYSELGPFGISEQMEIKPRPINWNMDAHLLAIDNPLGTGFSFTESLDRMVTNETTVGEDLYIALQQFFDLFPEYRGNKFYATGESYAGKYIPAVSYAIHTKNKEAPKAKHINLQGLAIGDGAFDPITQFQGFGDLFFNLGMANAKQKEVYDRYTERMNTKYEQKDYRGAFMEFDEMLNGDFYPYGTYYANTTGMSSNYFNFDESPNPGSSPFYSGYNRWLNLASTKAALHVGADATFSACNSTVEAQLLDDWMLGVVEWLQELLDHYDVLIYSGQYDVILGPPGTMRAVDKLQWSGAAAYAKAASETWLLNDTDPNSLAGYARVSKNANANDFSYVMLRGAGHMVPEDQPARAYDMLQRFLVPMKPLPPLAAHSG